VLTAVRWALTKYKIREVETSGYGAIAVGNYSVLILSLANLRAETGNSSHRDDTLLVLGRRNNDAVIEG
jgi:hypothetical protein